MQPLWTICSCPIGAPFLTYVQRFNITPQATSLSSNATRGLIPEPSTGMYVMKRAVRANGMRIGDVVPLSQITAVVELTPYFGVKADSRLAFYNSLECSTEFFLNKYDTKEMFHVLHQRS